MGKRLLIVLALLTILAYGWPAWTWFVNNPLKETPFFALHPVDESINPDPFVKSGFINPGVRGRRVHVGSICEMPEGRLAAVWYGGTREGARDVAIFFSKKSAGSDTFWSSPRIIVDRVSATQELRRYIKKVGNPILFRGPDEQLWLIYVTITVGGWSGSSLNVKASKDGGNTWTKSQRLTLSPFFNISELVKGRPVALEGGKHFENQTLFAIPIYHECLGYFPEILWFFHLGNQNRIIYRKTRMTGGSSLIQPTVAPLDDYSATAFYRCLAPVRKIAMARTEDGGRNWSHPRFIGLPNPDSAVDALPFGEGRILLAFNDSRNNREVLRLAVSKDGGRNWIRIHTLENSPQEEFSYPYMIRGRNGMIHLVYTWKRERIRHVVFNETWIEQQLEMALRE